MRAAEELVKFIERGQKRVGRAGLMLSMHSEDELLQESTDHVNDRETCLGAGATGTM